MSYRLSSDLRIIESDGQLIMMDVGQGKFFSCNRLGTLIVTYIRAGESLEMIVRKLEGRFSQSPDTINRDTRRFIEFLISKRLCHVAK